MEIFIFKYSLVSRFIQLSCFVSTFSVIIINFNNLFTLKFEFNFFSDNTLLKVLMCFSLQYNCEELVSTHQKPSDVQALHGIRALSALALIISHKVMALFYNPYINRTKMVEVRLKFLTNIYYIYDSQ